jgi:hypothetical protein
VLQHLLPCLFPTGNFERMCTSTNWNTVQSPLPCVKFQHKICLYEISCLKQQTWGWWSILTFAIFDMCVPTKINKPQFTLDIHSQTLFKSVQALPDKIYI